MFLLDEQQRKYIIPGIQSDYYRKSLTFFLDVFKHSRSNESRSHRINLLRLQKQLAETETGLWETLRCGRKIAKQLHAKKALSKSEEQDLGGVERNIFIHKELIRISRTICDGMAWRNMQYNRFLLQTMCRGYGAGAIDTNSKEFKSMLGCALHFSNHSNTIFIINDLTRFLRIGDLTEIDGEKIIAHELKMKPKYLEVRNFVTLSRNKAMSGQTKRLLEFQRIAMLNRIETPGGIVESSFIPVIPKTHANTIQDLMNRSEKEIAAQVFIEPFLKVSVMNFKNSIRSDEQTEKYKSIFSRGTWNKNDIVLPHSTWDAFHMDERGNFVRACAPYSIFPFTDEQGMDLMSGLILIKSEINLSILKECLQRHNWKIIDLDIETKVKSFEKEKEHIFENDHSLQDVMPDEGLFMIERGPFHVTIPFTWLTRMSMEFLMFQSFLDTLEYMYEEAAKRKTSSLRFITYATERKLWN